MVISNLNGGEPDVVLIGAGHNGLVAANHIADSGKKVPVVEASDHVGGLTCSTNPIPEAPDHLIHPFSFDPFFWDSLPPTSDLRLEQDWQVRVDPGLVYLHPGGESVAVWEDPQKTADEISYFSPKDGRAYMDFAGLLKAMSDLLLTFGTANPTRIEVRPLAKVGWHAFRHRRRLAEVAELASGMAAAAVEQRFEHPIVQDLMQAVAASTLPNVAGGSRLGFLWLANQHRHSHRHPICGIQSLPEALTRRLRKKGSDVRTSARVAEIAVTNRKASGVLLHDGTTIRARDAVIAACDPVQTFSKLMPPDAVPDDIKDKVLAMPVSNQGYGQMKVDIAFHGRLQLSRHAKWRNDDIDLRRPMHILGTAEGVQRSFARSAAGLLPYEDDYSLWTAIPTASDPSQAPDGQDNFYGYVAVAPIQPEGGRDAEKKRDAGQAVVNKFAKFVDGVEELELGRQVATNEDFTERGNMTAGNLTHIDMNMSRGGPGRPAPRLGGHTRPHRWSDALRGRHASGRRHHRWTGLLHDRSRISAPS